MNADVRKALKMIDAMTGTQSTEEQLELASDFTRPLASFANPGTGKSHTIIKGIILAQTYHQIPGRKINAMSFTREATAELKARYDKACKQCGITPTVTFNTFHRICNEILREKYPKMKIKEGFDWEKDLQVLQQYMKQRGLETEDMFYVKRVLQAITSLNNQLCYDPINVMSKYAFKDLDMSLDMFQQLRGDMFSYGLTTKVIPQGDIPIYALYVLALDTALQERYKARYKIMIVDEFQDMTKLYLVILSMISSNLIVIGDLKQQIYGFNGACSDIVNEYLKMYPDAREINLTQSFRCRNEIADYATQLYWPNDRRVKAFTGIGDNGTVRVCQDSELNLKDIIAKVKIEQDKEGLAKSRSTMFLFRNNFSVTPVAEELYKQHVLFRVKKFYKVMDYPIFRELSTLAMLAMEPSNERYQINAVKLFPEFRGYNEYNCPYLQCMRGKSIFDVNYRFREMSSSRILEALKKANEYIAEGKTAGKVFNVFWNIYDEYIIEGKWWKLEHDAKFYIDLVAPIVESKTFPEMLADEYDKAKKVQDCVNAGMGVKCYTMHSAKGLEADDVYILDADDTIIPSAKNLSKLVKAGCEYEAAKLIREERNLLYVAVTRAVDNVVITYYSKLTPLISSPKDNEYSYLDEIYACSKNDFDDVGAFLRILNMQDRVNLSRSEESASYVDVVDDAVLEDL